MKILLSYTQKIINQTHRDGPPKLVNIQPQGFVIHLKALSHFRLQNRISQNQFAVPLIIVK